MASEMFVFQSTEASRLNTVTTSNVANRWTTPRNPSQTVCNYQQTPYPASGLQLGYNGPASIPSSGPLSSSSYGLQLTLDDLDVSLVEETGSLDRLSPVTSPMHSTCFDKDSRLVRTCIKKPMTDRSAASSGLSLRSSLFRSPPGSTVQTNYQQQTLSNRSAYSEVPAISKQNDDQEALTPIHSFRLRPIRQQTKNVMLSVTDSSCVILEFIKAINGLERVLEVMKISVDGKQVHVYHPNGNEGYILGNNPPDLKEMSETKEYHYTDLPPKYLKRYRYAARFVRLVQSKTPKITMYTTEAKCVLMENSPEADFEALFYKGGKVRQSREGTSLTRKDGTTRHLLRPDQHPDLALEETQIWDHAQECHKKCLQIESLLESMQTQESKEFSPFPVTMGRRPANSYNQGSNDFYSCLSNEDEIEISGSPSILSNMTNQNKPQKYVPQRYTTPTPSQLMSAGVPNSQNSHVGSSITSSPTSVLHKVFVPHIGWGVQLSNGLVLVQFIDGSELTIQSSPMLITFKDSHQISSYGEKDQLPPQVCKLLETLPIVMNQLQATSPGY